jgi:hypothetical protein
MTRIREKGLSREKDQAIRRIGEAGWLPRFSRRLSCGDFKDRFDLHANVFRQAAEPHRRAGVSPGLAEHFN